MIAIKFTIFSISSILLNLLSQYVVFHCYSGVFDLYVAMAAGTVVGLVAKYVLDKKFIFYHSPKTLLDDAGRFVLYSSTGIFTTGIFWGTEVLFAWIFSSSIAKYIGALIGLGIGYVCKYFLDKRFVFSSGRSNAKKGAASGAF